MFYEKRTKMIISNKKYFRFTELALYNYEKVIFVCKSWNWALVLPDCTSPAPPFQDCSQISSSKKMTWNWLHLAVCPWRNGVPTHPPPGWSGWVHTVPLGRTPPAETWEISVHKNQGKYFFFARYWSIAREVVNILYHYIINPGHMFHNTIPVVLTATYMSAFLASCFEF